MQVLLISKTLSFSSKNIYFQGEIERCAKHNVLPCSSALLDLEGQQTRWLLGPRTRLPSDRRRTRPSGPGSHAPRKSPADNKTNDWPAASLPQYRLLILQISFSNYVLVHHTRTQKPKTPQSQDYLASTHQQEKCPMSTRVLNLVLKGNPFK